MRLYGQVNGTVVLLLLTIHCVSHMARGSCNLVKQVIGNFLGHKRKISKCSLPLWIPPEKCHCVQG
jgi:hypothetical protein